MRYLLFDSTTLLEVENFINNLKVGGNEVIQNPSLNDVKTEDVILVSNRQFCITCYGFSGIEMDKMLEIMNNLQSSGHDVFLVNLEPNARVPQKIIKNIQKFQWFPKY